MHQEKYSLSWQTYSDHLKSLMKEMMLNEDLSDVTLVTEDKKQIKANISILCASSPVLKDILKKEKNLTTIMYLRGIQYSELESIMQFIYLGEATFYKERMDDLLAVAKSLEIKLLCNAEFKLNDERDDYPLPSNKDTSTVLVEEQIKLSDDLKKQALRQLKQENVEKYETYTGSGAFNTHKQSVHQDVKYACDQCEYQATSQVNLTKHIQSKHEGIRYACDQCDQQFTQNSCLTCMFVINVTTKLQDKVS